jgi:hypothetical protein
MKRVLQDEIARLENDISSLEDESVKIHESIESDVKTMMDDIITMEHYKKIYEDVLNIDSLKRKRDAEETGLC